MQQLLATLMLRDFSYRKVTVFMFSISMAGVVSAAHVASFCDCSRCECSRRSEFIFASTILVTDVVSVAVVAMIKDVEILTFIANVPSVADVAIPIRMAETSYTRTG